MSNVSFYYFVREYDNNNHFLVGLHHYWVEHWLATQLWLPGEFSGVGGCSLVPDTRMANIVLT